MGRFVVSLVTIGGAIALTVGFVLAQFLSSLLYGVQPWDPSVYAAVPLLLALVILAGTFLPALRATRVDPIVALRYEWNRHALLHRPGKSPLAVAGDNDALPWN